MPNPKLYSTTETAELLGISDSLVRRYLREGRLKGLEVGKFWVISETEISRFEKIKRVRGNPNFKKDKD